jgi:hypothetical protein
MLVLAALPVTSLDPPQAAQAAAKAGDIVFNREVWGTSPSSA